MAVLFVDRLSSIVWGLFLYGMVVSSSFSASLWVKETFQLRLEWGVSYSILSCPGIRGLCEVGYAPS